MTCYKVLGFMISLSLLFGYEPMAEAAPVTVPSSAVTPTPTALLFRLLLPDPLGDVLISFEGS